MPPPHSGSKENEGFEDERGYNLNASFDSLPEPERPPLRHIDTYCMPECPCLSKRYTIAVLACVGNYQMFIKHQPRIFKPLIRGESPSRKCLMKRDGIESIVWGNANRHEIVNQVEVISRAFFSHFL